jgi:hypothetical protein
MFLSIEQSAVKAKSLVQWQQAELDQLATQVCASLKEWLISSGLLPSMYKQIEATASAASSCSHLRDEEWELITSGCWLAGPAATFKKSLYASLMGDVSMPITHSGSTASLANKLVQGVYDDFIAALNGSASGTTNDADQEQRDWNTWAGAIVLNLQLFGSTWHLFIAPDAAKDRLSQSVTAKAKKSIQLDSVLTPVLSCVKERVLEVQIELKTFEISLDALMQLRLGDTLGTGHNLNDPLLMSSGGVPLAEVFLGQSELRRSIVLVAA